jgi:hypothetical protein
MHLTELEFARENRPRPNLVVALAAMMAAGTDPMSAGTLTLTNKWDPSDVDTVRGFYDAQEEADRRRRINAKGIPYPVDRRRRKG